MSAAESAFTQGEALGWEIPTTGTAECIACYGSDRGMMGGGGFARHAQSGRSKMPQGEQGVNRAIRLPSFLSGTSWIAPGAPSPRAFGEIEVHSCDHLSRYGTS
jgi:hypothetical protein